MTDTKPDTSREAVERHFDISENHAAGLIPIDTVILIRDLLDAKEAAEKLAEQRAGDIEVLIEWKEEELTEARASAAAAWEAGRDAAAYAIPAFPEVAEYLRTLTNPDPSATEALRRVKEGVWDEGHNACAAWVTDERHIPNPYRQPKESARD